MPEPRNAARQYWKAFAAMDADEIAERFAPQASFRFGNGRVLHGRAAIRRLFVGLFAQMSQIEGRSIVEWSEAACVVDEVDLSFVFDDGRRLTIPVTTVFRGRGPEIEECWMSFYPEPALEQAGQFSLGRGAA